MKPIAIISTDWHIKLDNSEQSKDLAAQKIQLAIKKGVTTLICLGDIFESRQAQPEEVLHTFKEILDMIYESGMTLYLIPGNHDKTNYSSWKSYLDVYKTHPGLRLFEIPTYQTIGQRDLLFAPFIEESTWLESVREKFDEVCSTTLLLSHIAVEGSQNNDGSKVESRVNGTFLKQFKKVLLGHYHNAQQPYKNTFHLPSWKQNNFGEDNQKGFTILYDDEEFTTEFVKSSFKEFEILDLDAGKVSPETISQLIEEKQNANIYLRVDLVGKQNDINSLDLNKLKSAGIKIKSIPEEIKVSIESAEVGETVNWEKEEKVLEAFSTFCSERELNEEEGLYFLKELLQRNGKSV